MKCPECGAPMVIAEWNGWVWECFHCDYVGRTATNEETEKHYSIRRRFLRNEKNISE
jgi:ribosomal protein L37AE/L43A